MGFSDFSQLQDLSNGIWGQYIYGEGSNLMKDSKYADIGQFGLGLAQNVLQDYFSQSKANSAPVPAPLSSTFNISGQKWQPQIDQSAINRTLVEASSSNPITRMKAQNRFNNLMDSRVTEFKNTTSDLIQAKPLSESTDTYVKSPSGTQQAISGGAGALVGAGVGMGMNALGSKVFGNTTGGQFATQVLSQGASTAAGSIGSTVAGNIASGVGAGTNIGSNLASIFSNAGSLTSLGAGVVNIGLDLFDKQKKSKWESGVNIGLGLASMIPGIGPFAALGALAFNGIGHAIGRRTSSFTADTDLLAQAGGSYGATANRIMTAQSLANTKYSGFNRGEFIKANDAVQEGAREQKILGDIMEDSNDRRTIAGAMSSINASRRALAMQKYNQSAVSVGRYGMVLQRAKRITSSLKYQKGGKVSDPFQTYLQTLPENQRDDSNFRVRDYWEFNGRPKNFDEAVFRGMFTQFEDGWHANSVAENPKTGEIEFMKSSSHPSIQKELDWYDSDDASEFRNQYELQKTEPYFKYVKRKGTDQPQSFKEGGSITKSDWLIEVDVNNIPFEFRGEDIEEVELDSILPEFKEGGKFNLIPEGALHARKHNMDVEGITPKGIPVVSEAEGGELEQQAEIEREEIIFRLEVTKKIEELAKNGSDEAAIEAGKLLVEEILYNTIDNTNNLI